MCLLVLVLGFWSLVLGSRSVLWSSRPFPVLAAVSASRMLGPMTNDWTPTRTTDAGPSTDQAPRTLRTTDQARTKDQGPRTKDQREARVNYPAPVATANSAFSAW